jgi:hypothetical protein
VEVYVVQHVHEFEDGTEDVKLIGVYSTEERAKSAVARLSENPGFKETPKGFSVDRYLVDRDHWLGGFETVVSEEPAGEP